MIEITAASAVLINNAMVKDIKKFLFKNQIGRIIVGIVAQMTFMIFSMISLLFESKTSKYVAILFLIPPSVFTAAAMIRAKIKYKKLLGVLGVTNEDELEHYLEHSEKLKYAYNTYTFLKDGMVVDFTKLEYFYISDIRNMTKSSYDEYYGTDDSNTTTVTIYVIKISLNKHDRLPRKFRLKYKSFIERDAVFLNLAKAYSEYGDPIDIVKDQVQLK